jgi:hypothetical protein
MLRGSQTLAVTARKTRFLPFETAPVSTNPRPALRHRQLLSPSDQARERGGTGPIRTRPRADTAALRLCVTGYIVMPEHFTLRDEFADNFPIQAHNGITIPKPNTWEKVMPVHPQAKNLPVEHMALAPEFHSPAVARCCQAWNRVYRANRKAGTNPISTSLRANEAYRNAMPPLSSPRNICDFVACVAYALVVRAMCQEQATSLLHAAGVASRAFKLAASTANTAAPRAAQRKNKISGYETVDWNFIDLETITYAKEASPNAPGLGPKSA